MPAKNIMMSASRQMAWQDRAISGTGKTKSKMSASQWLAVRWDEEIRNLWLLVLLVWRCVTWVVSLCSSTERLNMNVNNWIWRYEHEHFR